MAFFSRLAESAGDLQRHTGLAAVTAIFVACAPALVGKISFKARGARISLLAVGLLILAWGLLLFYVKLSKPTIKVPSIALTMILGTAIIFLLVFGLLWWHQNRLLSKKISDLIEATAIHIRIYQQKFGAQLYVEETTNDDESVLPRLTSLVRQLRREQRIFLLGQLGAGKTATLLKFAIDCSRLRSGSGRQLIAMYADLAEYAARSEEGTQLQDFILGQFGDATRRTIIDAWNQPGLNVNWIFVFDNADDAGLRWAARQRSWDFEVSAFVNRPAELAPFHAVIACRATPESRDADYIIRLKGLTATGRDKLLAQAQINPADVAALARDKSFNSYLANPATLGLLAPTLARRTWTNSYNVHVAMSDAIDHLVRRRPHFPPIDPNSLLSTAAAAVTFLRTRPDIDPESPGEMREVVARVALETHQPQSTVRRELIALADRSIIRRIPGRGSTEYVEFGPAVAAYFYARELLKDPGGIEVRELLLNTHSRLTILSLLKAADDELVSRFVRISEQMLEETIADLYRTQQHLVSAPHEAKPQWTDETNRSFGVLSLLIDGLQDRLELLGEQLKAKAIEFTGLITPIAPTGIQASLPEVSYALGAPEQAISIIARGFVTSDGAQVLDAASRMVNAMSEDTEIEGHHGQLVRVIILAGLRSLTLNRGRDDVPYGLRLADSAGAAAIILYGFVFGLGGLLQLSEYWRHPSVQILEIILAAFVTGPMIAARYNKTWRRYILGKDIKNIMSGASGFLALFGVSGGVLFIAGGLATFTFPTMPLLICYSLLWPAAALFYLESEPHPTVANVIFPLPRTIHTLWRIIVVERSRK